MDLPHKFEEQAAKKTTDYNAPPFKIRGKDLDENFNRVKPKSTIGDQSIAYTISEDSKDGWKMEFSYWPPPDQGDAVLISRNRNMTFTVRAPENGTYVLGAINGKITWIQTEACEEEA